MEEEIFKKLHIDVVSKYGIEQEVFYMENNQVKKNTIIEIFLNRAIKMTKEGIKEENVFQYRLCSYNLTKSESELFESKAKLIQSL